MRSREGALKYEMKRLHSYRVFVNDVELLRGLKLLCMTVSPLEVKAATAVQSLSRIVPSVHLRRPVCTRLRKSKLSRDRVVKVVVNYPRTNPALFVGELLAVNFRYCFVPLLDIGSVKNLPTARQVWTRGHLIHGYRDNPVCDARYKLTITTVPTIACHQSRLEFVFNLRGVVDPIWVD